MFEVGDKVRCVDHSLPSQNVYTVVHSYQDMIGFDEEYPGPEWYESRFVLVEPINRSMKIYGNKPDWY